MPKNNLFGKALSLGMSILMISLLFFAKDLKVNLTLLQKLINAE